MSRPDYKRASSTNLGSTSAPRSLQGKLAIVTGGSRGIGAAIAKTLATKGCSVVLGYTSDNSSAKTEELAKSLETDYHVKALPVQADLASTSGPAYLVETVKNHFSHPKTKAFQIDIVINNAGVSINKPTQDLTPDDFHKQYNVNVLGPLLLMQAVLPYLPNDRSGRVVNLSSVSSSLGFIGQTVYGGSKAALEAMTRTWAREFSERATVNAINPGPVATEMWNDVGEEFEAYAKPWQLNTPLAATRPGIDEQRFVDDSPRTGGRPAYDHEIAGVVAMLCSDDAGWCTGSVVCANGGMRFSS